MTKKSKFYVDISTGAQYNHMGIEPKTGILAYWHIPTQHNLQTMVTPNIYNQQTMAVEHQSLKLLLLCVLNVA